MNISGTEFNAICTPLLLTLLVVGGVVLDMTFFKKRPRAMGIYTLIGIGVIFVLQSRLLVLNDSLVKLSPVAFGGQYHLDRFSVIFNLVFLIAAGAAGVLSLTHMRGKEDHRGEYYILLAIATIGMCMMAAAADFLILFIGLEVMSIPIYILVGIERRNPRSGEASIKYLILGALGSAILLYGIALLYGVTGHIDYKGVFSGIAETVNFAWSVVRQDQAEAFAFWKVLERMDLLAQVEHRHEFARFSMLLFALAFILAGFFFKIAAVPFHMWTPDVYEGAPTPITAFMATGVKAAAFAALIRLGLSAFAYLWGLTPMYEVLAVVAILTMTLGNIVAIAQKNVKRMLAYSAIAHAGYLLVGMAALIASGQFVDEDIFNIIDRNAFVNATAMESVRPMIFYLITYTFMNIGAFGVIVALSTEKPGAETLDDFSGLSIKRPGMAVIMAICMLSLAGIPPLAGFAAKFYLFKAAVANRLYILAVIGVLNSVVSAYYYLRVLIVMYMQPEKEPLGDTPKSSFSAAMIVNVIMAVLVVLIGMFPGVILVLMRQALPN